MDLFNLEYKDNVEKQIVNSFNIKILRHNGNSLYAYGNPVKFCEFVHKQKGWSWIYTGGKCVYKGITIPPGKTLFDSDKKCYIRHVLTIEEVIQEAEEYFLQYAIEKKKENSLWYEFIYN